MHIQQIVILEDSDRYFWPWYESEPSQRGRDVFIL